MASIVTARELAPMLFDAAPVEPKRQFKFEVENGLDEQASEDEKATGLATDLCKMFYESKCTKGSFCQYRHSRNDRLVVCKHWLRGLCKMNEFCLYLHEFDMSKMPECQFFSEYNECTNAECMYRHIDPDRKRTECPYYNRGFCRHGSKCRHKHIRKEPCANYLRGFCKDGPTCVFGHPKFEMARLEDDAGAAPMPGQTTVTVQSGPAPRRPPTGQWGPGPPTGAMADGGPVPPVGSSEPTPGVVCHHCQRSGHIRPQCPFRNQNITQ